jgi:hypothetical protein
MPEIDAAFGIVGRIASVAESPRQSRCQFGELRKKWTSVGRGGGRWKTPGKLLNFI